MSRIEPNRFHHRERYDHSNPIHPSGLKGVSKFIDPSIHLFTNSDGDSVSVLAVSSPSCWISLSNMTTSTTTTLTKSVTTSTDINEVPPEQVLNVNIGVLGHVDSGKTSLVKALSTLLSTAALDKSKQSRQRGMTLDLGFSCFFLDTPPHLAKDHPGKTKLQMTLVDCPGHASLIKTIIGGAQIIDAVLLVVDAFKGWQAQTTECLVLAELTSPHLVVALNKVDQFPEHERKSRLAEAKKLVRQRLAKTRFADAALVGVSACVGGEKVAATNVDGSNSNANSSSNSNSNTGASGGSGNKVSSSTTAGAQETHNMDVLVETLRSQLPSPRRNPSDHFYFSIDHCFPIRGKGTVLTGTVLSGHVSVNNVLEFPTLGLERKVKSMQMFKRSVPTIQQGDRAGICVSNFDAKQLERGIAASPGAVQLLRGAVALVRKVPYYKGKLPCKSRFHLSVGHTTIMATVSFWGARELLQQQEAAEEAAWDQSDNGNDETLRGHSSLGGDADMAGLPRIPFDFQQGFVAQDELLESVDGETGSLLHWAILDFQTPVYCPLDSLVIGSRLDAVDSKSSNNNNNNNNINTSSSSSSSCRLAFSGRLVEKVDPKTDMARIRIYTPKEKRGRVCKLGDPHRREDDQKVVRYEIFGDELFKKETNMKPFVGMKLLTEQGDIGEIKSSFGTSGKFRMWFPGGTEAKEGDPLVLPFKRYAHDEKKEMHQDLVLPKNRIGKRLESQPKQKKKKNTVVQTGKIANLKGDPLDNGKHPMAIVSGFFTPEINIRTKLGTKVWIPGTKEEGKIAGPFGKAGKCKVAFEKGVSAKVGSKAELHEQQDKQS